MPILEWCQWTVSSKWSTLFYESRLKHTQRLWASSVSKCFVAVTLEKCILLSVVTLRKCIALKSIPWDQTQEFEWNLIIHGPLLFMYCYDPTICCCFFPNRDATFIHSTFFVFFYQKQARASLCVKKLMKCNFLFCF